MAIESTITSVEYTGTGEAQTFAMPFPVLEPEHVAVAVTDAEGGAVEFLAGRDYAVRITADSLGFAQSADVVLTVPLPAEWTLIARRMVPIIQPARLAGQGGYYPATLERGLDRLTMISQQLANDKADRADLEAAKKDLQKTLDDTLAGIDSGNDELRQAIAAEAEARTADDKAAAEALKTEVAARAEMGAGLQKQIEVKANQKQVDEAIESLDARAVAMERDKVDDAPSDGKIYGRKDKAWIETGAGSGGGIDFPASQAASHILGTDAQNNRTWFSPEAVAELVAPHLSGGGGNAVVSSLSTSKVFEIRDDGETSQETINTGFRACFAATRGNIATLFSQSAELETALDETDAALAGFISDASTALAGKADKGELNSLATKSELNAGLDGRALATHSHSKSQISDLLNATTAADGMMSKEDKAKLNDLSNGGGGAILGEIRLFPFRRTELPPGWYYPSGDYVAQSSAQGQALVSFSSTFKSDWGITVSGSNIRLCDPAKFFNGAFGRFFRPVNNSNRMPGSIESDAQQNITGSYDPTTQHAAAVATTNSSPPKVTGVFGVSNWSSPYSFAGQNGSGSSLTIDASKQIRTAAEVRPINVGMTPAIYLGV